MSDAETILRQLDALSIPFAHGTHPPAATMEDCAALGARWDAVYCKNYFLTTRSGKLFALCVVRPTARFHTADISKQAGTPRLTFAGPEAMDALLGTYPGAVTPLGLLNDRAHAVRLLVDEGLRQANRLAFHPCDNRHTVVLTAEGFFGRFLPATGHVPQFVQIHDFE